jgi:hypothetical protein
MLVDIFSGRDRQSALSKGSFHFSALPSHGEQLELAGERLAQTRHLLSWRQVRDSGNRCHRTSSAPSSAGYSRRVWLNAVTGRPPSS